MCFARMAYCWILPSFAVCFMRPSLVAFLRLSRLLEGKLGQSIRSFLVFGLRSSLRPESEEREEFVYWERRKFRYRTRLTNYSFIQPKWVTKKLGVRVNMSHCKYESLYDSCWHWMSHLVSRMWLQTKTSNDSEKENNNYSSQKNKHLSTKQKKK